jgi:hypothetical protein
MNFEIGFWVIFGIIFTILAFFIWLCVRKTKDDRIMQVSSIGLGYLIHQYLVKSFQKVCLMLIKSNQNSDKISIDTISIQQTKFVNLYKPIFTKELLKFIRGQEVLTSILVNISNTKFQDLDLFLFPDILISKNEYYNTMLFLASEKTMHSPLRKSNEDAKKYLDELIKKSNTCH